MYAICLLALLADVARSQVPLSVGSDSTAGLIVRAAGQFRTEALPEAELLDRSNARLKPADVTLLLLTHLLTWQDGDWQGRKIIARANGKELAAVAADSDCRLHLGGGLRVDLSLESAALSPSNFAHVGSPAP